MLPYQVSHCDEPPPLAGEVPQCAHWGGEGVQSADPLHRFAVPLPRKRGRLMLLRFQVVYNHLRQHRIIRVRRLRSQNFRQMAQNFVW